MTHDKCNSDAQSIAIGEKERNKFFTPALKYGLNMNIFWSYWEFEFCCLFVSTCRDLSILVGV